MPIETAGIFTIDYTLRTRAYPGDDIQFGMDFVLSQPDRGRALPLTQLIYPAVKVANNRPGIWNVDNHRPAGSSAACLIFPGAEEGVIVDPPTEISKRGKGVLTTKFAVYRVDVDRNEVQRSGVTFGYRIDTDSERPETVFTGLSMISIPGDQRAAVLAKCATVTFR